MRIRTSLTRYLGGPSPRWRRGAGRPGAAWRGAAAAAAAAGVVATSVIAMLGTAGPAQAGPAQAGPQFRPSPGPSSPSFTDCLTDATGSLTISPAHVIIAQSVKVSWTWQTDKGCLVAVVIFGPGFTSGTHLAASGSMTVTPATTGTSSWRLNMTATGDNGVNTDLRTATASVAAPPLSSTEVAYATSAGTLGTLTPAGVTTFPAAQLASGSSPAISANSGGGYTAAFRATDGDLWRAGSSLAPTSTRIFEFANTSPGSVLPGGFAFVGNNNDLEFADPSGAVTDTGGFFSVAGGTSPAALTTAGLDEAVFADGINDLWTVNLATDAGSDTTFALQAGTSPSIAGTGATAGQANIAYHGSNGDLWVLPLGGSPTDLGLPVASGTSPSITEVAGDTDVIAYQDPSGGLREVSPAGTGGPIGVSMAAGTSPSITGDAGGGTVAAVQSSAGHLVTYDSGTGTLTDTGIALAPATSPAITATTPLSFP